MFKIIIGINEGHCLKGMDTGAVGVNGIKEQDYTRMLGTAIKQKLAVKGNTIVNCTVNSATSVNEALQAICKKADAQHLDWFISLHFNASDLHDGHGSEIYTFAGAKHLECVNILKNLERLGYANRGVKDGSRFAVVHGPNAKAMLIENCFIDNQVDMDIYNVDRVSDAIVSGIMGCQVPVTEASSKKRTGVVTAPTLNVRESRSTASIILGTLKKGDTVKIDKEIDGWYSIYYGNHGGFVSAEYIK